LPPQRRQPAFRQLRCQLPSYDDRAAFDAHLATAHYAEFNTGTADWVASKTVRHYQRIDP